MSTPSRFPEGHSSGDERLIRDELVRKVASLLREWSDIEQRIVNLTGVPVRRQPVAAWIAAEILGVSFPDTLARESGMGVLPSADWCEGFGPETYVRWWATSAAPEATRLAGSCYLDFSGADGIAAPSRAQVPGWTIERLDLVQLSQGPGARQRARCVFDVDGAVSLLSPRQTAALRLLSVAARSPLTRYH